MIKRIILEDKQYFKEITDSEINVVDSQFDRLFDKLVPSSGMASTVEGEMLRAISKLVYRYFNDGDYYFKGYGIETCGKSAEYLKNSTPISNELRPLLNSARTNRSKIEDEYTDKDLYTDYLYKVEKKIIDYVMSRQGNYTPNSINSII